MEDGSMLNKLIKLCQQAILYELCLQERSFVNRTVKKALKANIPKEVGAVLFGEKVFTEAFCKVR